MANWVFIRDLIVIHRRQGHEFISETMKSDYYKVKRHNHSILRVCVLFITVSKDCNKNLDQIYIINATTIIMWTKTLKNMVNNNN